MPSVSLMAFMVLAFLISPMFENTQIYMNDTFGVPVTRDKARLNSRRTIVNPSVEHVLSEYKSLNGLRENYCYLIQPNCPWVYFRKYNCTTCMKCKDLDFLNCINPSRGRWKKTKIELK